MSSRLLVHLASHARFIDGKEIPSVIPKVFTDWYDLADYIKQENEAGRSVTITKWEYV